METHDNSANFCICLRSIASGKYAEAYEVLAEAYGDQPASPHARLLTALFSLPPEARGQISTAMLPFAARAPETGDDYERVAEAMRGAGLDGAAKLANELAFALDYQNAIVNPSWGESPFNGDKKRQAFFKALVGEFNFAALVETGTYRGATTKFFSDLVSCPIYTCELSARHILFAEDRLRGVENIHLKKKDSRTFLKEVASDLNNLSGDIFVYLDAHWNADLPLREELEILFKTLGSPLIMIDDFEVPSTSLFRFDDYGPTAILSTDYLASVLPAGFSLFYPDWTLDPAAPPSRGFVLIAREEIAGRIHRVFPEVCRENLSSALLKQMLRYRALLKRVAPDFEDLESKVQSAADAKAEHQRFISEKSALTTAFEEERTRLASEKAALTSAFDEERVLWLAEREASREQSEAMSAQVAELTAKHHALSCQLQEAIASTSAANETIERRRQHSEELKRDIGRLQNQLGDFQARIAEATRICDELRQQHDKILRSRTWRRVLRIRKVLREYKRIRNQVKGLLTFGRRVRTGDAGAAFAPALEAPPADPARLSVLQAPDFNLGPLKFIPHDGGFFSNFNFLVGEIYLGRRLYPLFSLDEVKRHSDVVKHFAYGSPNMENSWFCFFKPIQYEVADTLHQRTDAISRLPDSLGHYAPDEFRMPAASIALYTREDFRDWRLAVNRSIRGLFAVTDEIQATIDGLVSRMPAYKVGVHVRHPSHLVEQGHIFFEDYFERIDAVLKEHPEAGIFVASDNELALAVIQQRYHKNNVFSYPGFIRESIDDVMSWAYALVKSQSDDMGFVNGIGFQTHYRLAASGDVEAGIRNGVEAVTDLFTLALCDEFVCTASNFTLTCAFLNPEQKQHLVSSGVRRQR